MSHFSIFRLVPPSLCHTLTKMTEKQKLYDENELKVLVYELRKCAYFVHINAPSRSKKSKRIFLEFLRRDGQLYQIGIKMVILRLVDP